jgi:hypothetical protein
VHPVRSARAAALIGAGVGFVLAVPISIGAGVEFGWLLFLVLLFAALGANLGANAYRTARTVGGARGRKRAQLPRPGPLEIFGALLGLVVGAVVGLDESVAAAFAFALFLALSGLLLGGATGTLLPWAWAKPMTVEPSRSAAVSTLAGAVALTTMWGFTGQDQLPIGPWVGAALGFIVFLAAEELIESFLERSRTGWSTRRHALALTGFAQ